jgi:acyl dehydratase
MPLNRALVAKRYPVQAFRLDAERVVAFANAVAHPGDGLPPTCVTAPEQAALANVIADPELGLDYSRVVHGEQEYEWGRPLAVGETLTVEASIEEIRSGGGFELLSLRTEMRDESGRVVVVGRATLIVRRAS